MKDIKKTLGLLFAISTISPNGYAAWGPNIKFYEYVVITNRTLAPAFEELVAWKNQKGLNAGIVTVEDICKDPEAKKGDVISNITGNKTDSAAMIRRYLQSSVDAKKGKYVLLGGMSNIVPVRYGIGTKDNNEKSLIPSDLYYSALSGNWDKDKDGIYGEKDEDDIWGEYKKNILYVGRLLCRTEADVRTWTRKQLIYEQNPGLGDHSYLSRAFTTEADNLGSRTYVQNNYPETWTETTWEEEGPKERPTFPKGADVINEINNTKYGVLTNCNHGNTMQYALATKGDNENGVEVKYQVLAQDDYDEKIDSETKQRVLSITIPESGNGFNNLTNYNYPAVMFSTSCMNMPFDDYRNNFSKHKMRNLGEAFLCMNNGGGIAYMGFTREGRKFTALQIINWFWTYADKDESYFGRDPLHNRLGYLEYMSKYFMNHRYKDEYGSSTHWSSLSHNLAGCPETYFWAIQPKKFSGIDVNSEANGNVWVSNAYLEGESPLVCLTGTNPDGSLYQKKIVLNKENKTAVFTGAPSDFVVVVSCERYLPYIYKSNECVVQNEKFSGVQSRNCDNIIAGAHVKMGKPEGDVIIKSGANVTFDAKNTTRLEGGFQVQKGGQLIIK